MSVVINDLLVIDHGTSKVAVSVHKHLVKHAGGNAMATQVTLTRDGNKIRMEIPVAIGDFVSDLTYKPDEIVLVNRDHNDLQINFPGVYGKNGTMTAEHFTTLKTWLGIQ